ncbi:MAG TPA: hypothetical protein VHD85_22390, partial [Terracidiphilus sp.]|nr:hypothetical protein [Terracidiphilus sp.]
KSAVLRELDEILNSPQFRNSKRYPALLEYIVRNTLEGKADQLKERTLGVEVFDRPPTYDTNTDTIVRYTAGEVRKRLLLYYSDGGRSSNLRISLPAGSYVPEFLFGADGRETDFQLDLGSEALPQDSGFDEHPIAHAPETGLPPGTVDSAEARPAPAWWNRERTLWLVVAGVLVAAAAVAGIMLRHREVVQEAAAIDEFWAPVLRDQHNIAICTGSVVFAPNNYSGVTTAGRDLDYTFVSMQIASAIAQVSDVTQRAGTSAQLSSAATTSMTQLREHPVILLGGYNNRWTLRLADSLRYHFALDREAILDRLNPSIEWQRDRSQPYSSADDFALAARFRDSRLDGWVVALAGLGRNGTEAAAQFVTNPHYMEMLRDRLGAGFASKNIEVVLKVSVVDGRSGAPAVLAVYAW